MRSDDRSQRTTKPAIQVSMAITAMTCAALQKRLDHDAGRAYRARQATVGRSCSKAGMRPARAASSSAWQREMGPAALRGVADRGADAQAGTEASISCGGSARRLPDPPAQHRDLRSQLVRARAGRAGRRLSPSEPEWRAALWRDQRVRGRSWPSRRCRARENVRPHRPRKTQDKRPARAAATIRGSAGRRASRGLSAIARKPSRRT
jgi:hypothetical protein